MKKKVRIKTSLLVSASAVAGLAVGASIALAHQPIPLYSYEEVATQMNGPANPANPFGAPSAPMPVLVNAGTKQGLPYSPKQSCSFATPGVNTGTCHDYSNISQHAFHASLGFNEWMDNDPSGLWIGDGSTGSLVPKGTQTGLNPQKPWLQSHGHNGKW